MTEFTATHDGWALCHDSINILHIVPLKSGNVLFTGQPFVEQFDAKNDASSRAYELMLSMKFDATVIDEILSQNFPE